MRLPSNSERRTKACDICSLRESLNRCSEFIAPVLYFFRLVKPIFFQERNDIIFNNRLEPFIINGFIFFEAKVAVTYAKSFTKRIINGNFLIEILYTFNKIVVSRMLSNCSESNAGLTSKNEKRRRKA